MSVWDAHFHWCSEVRWYWCQGHRAIFGDWIDGCSRMSRVVQVGISCCHTKRIAWLDSSKCWRWRLGKKSVNTIHWKGLVACEGDWAFRGCIGHVYGGMRGCTVEGGRSEKCKDAADRYFGSFLLFWDWWCNPVPNQGIRFRCSFDRSLCKLRTNQAQAVGNVLDCRVILFSLSYLIGDRICNHAYMCYHMHRICGCRVSVSVRDLPWSITPTSAHPMFFGRCRCWPFLVWLGSQLSYWPFQNINDCLTVAGGICDCEREGGM